MGLSLIAFDTDHIKRYVFGTNKSKEIRGASSILDELNRIVMTDSAKRFGADLVYANGGSGLFLVSNEQADAFETEVKQWYYDKTGGGASVTSVIVPAPEELRNADDDIPIPETLEIVQWRLQEAKLHPPAALALPSHSFLRVCDACGADYASPEDEEKGRRVARDPGEEDEQYCVSCQRKRERDVTVKELIDEKIERKKSISRKEYLWDQVISRLQDMKYNLSSQPKRPKDFNVFRNFKGSKDYIGLIYADANNMGRAIEVHSSLPKRGAFAKRIDDAIYIAVCTAIARHLKIGALLKPPEQQSGDLKHDVFPFDILLLGGDDVCMVVPAAVAFDVALTIAETFRKETSEEHSLSVGVVLAPIKYPFGFVRELGETTLKFAKKDGADARAQANREGKTIDDTRINFLMVTGGSGTEFSSVYKTMYHKRMKEAGQEFFATLRPFTPETLRRLLAALRPKDGMANLGRTKLHQLREAVLRMNLNTSVSEGLAVLRNWRGADREYVVRNVYEFAIAYQIPQTDTSDPITGFPRVTFPWFADGQNTKKNRTYDVYRTSLLDFIELYDMVAREGGDDSDTN